MSHSPENRPKVGVGVIVLRDGKILLGERLVNHVHDKPPFQLPGGHLEFGDSFEETARKEVQEETGLTGITVKGVVSVGNDIMGEKHYVTVGVLAESPEGEPHAAEPEKAKNWDWHDPKNLPENMFYSSRKIVENWMKGELYTD